MAEQRPDLLRSVKAQRSFIKTPRLKAAAEALAADYKAEYGVDLQVADSGEDAGDIVFTKDDKNGLGEEGYIMEMDDKVNVKAEQAQGAYWSTRSILQIVKLNNGEIPKGITKRLSEVQSKKL